jgi:hypothetical protein
MEAITFAKNEAYSREVAFHTRKGCRANIQTRDPETGWCYKNGGQPLWGYRLRHLERGIGRGGRALVKSIWELDDTIVAGRTAHEWAQECMERASKGASLDELRDFCNDSGIPARRNKYWSTSTWHSLLQPHVLLKYCGYGVWNVHRKNGTKRPSAEWIIVEKAHEPLISESVAQQILSVRRRRNADHNMRQARAASTHTSYLLSGGLFTCTRCASNMVGKVSRGHTYYVCGSVKYRRGLGCGRGVYIPQEDIEGEIVRGVQQICSTLLDSDLLTKKVNKELLRLWHSTTGNDPNAPKKIQRIDNRIRNIMRSIEEGLEGTEYANSRLRELMSEKTALQEVATSNTKPPQIDLKQVQAYQNNLARVLKAGTMKERRELIRRCIEGIDLITEDPKVTIKYKTPEIPSPALSQQLVAGAGFEPATFGL